MCSERSAPEQREAWNIEAEAKTGRRIPKPRLSRFCLRLFKAICYCHTIHKPSFRDYFYLFPGVLSKAKIRIRIKAYTNATHGLEKDTVRIEDLYIFVWLVSMFP